MRQGRSAQEERAGSRDILTLADDCVMRDIVEAHFYDHLLLGLVVPLAQDRALLRVANAVVAYMSRAFELGFVMALGKLYDRTDKPGLHKLVDAALALPDDFVNLKFEHLREPSRQVIRKRMERSRRKLRLGVERHHSRVRKIKSSYQKDLGCSGCRVEGQG